MDDRKSAIIAGVTFAVIGCANPTFDAGSSGGITTGNPALPSLLDGATTLLPSRKGHTLDGTFTHWENGMPFSGEWSDVPIFRPDADGEASWLVDIASDHTLWGMLEFATAGDTATAHPRMVDVALGPGRSSSLLCGSNSAGGAVAAGSPGTAAAEGDGSSPLGGYGDTFSRCEWWGVGAGPRVTLASRCAGTDCDSTSPWQAAYFVDQLDDSTISVRALDLSGDSSVLLGAFPSEAAAGGIVRVAGVNLDPTAWQWRDHPTAPEWVRSTPSNVWLRVPRNADPGTSLVLTLGDGDDESRCDQDALPPCALTILVASGSVLPGAAAPASAIPFAHDGSASPPSTDQDEWEHSDGVTVSTGEFALTASAIPASESDDDEVTFPSRVALLAEWLAPDSCLGTLRSDARLGERVDMPGTEEAMPPESPWLTSAEAPSWHADAPHPQAERATATAETPSDSRWVLRCSPDDDTRIYAFALMAAASGAGIALGGIDAPVVTEIIAESAAPEAHLALRGELFGSEPGQVLWSRSNGDSGALEVISWSPTEVLTLPLTPADEAETPAPQTIMTLIRADGAQHRVPVENPVEN